MTEQPSEPNCSAMAVTDGTDACAIDYSVKNKRPRIGPIYKKKRSVADIGGGGGKGTSSGPRASVAGSGGGGGEGIGSGVAGNTAFVPNYSKAEKKARKVLAKLELEPILGIKKVTILKTNNTLFTINCPEVYKNPTSNSYIVFGDHKVEDISQKVKLNAAQVFRKPNNMQTPPVYGQIRYISLKDKTDNQGNDGKINYQGVDKKDVELVCEQVKVDKQTAIEALLRNDKDIVNTILELTDV